MRTVALGLDVGVPGYLGDPGDAAINPQAGDYIGVATAHIGAEQQDVLIGDAAPGRERIGDGVTCAWGFVAEQFGEGPRQQKASAEADPDRQEHGTAFTPLAGPLGRRGSHPLKAIAPSEPFTNGGLLLPIAARLKRVDEGVEAGLQETP